MLVFIDESGDPGFKIGSGSSQFFTITAVIFDSSFSATACDRTIDELRRFLNRQIGYEFHFTNCSDRVRTLFLEKVSCEDFLYHSFVLNKSKLFSSRLHDAEALYNRAVEIVCENARPLLHDATVIIDKSNDRGFRQRLAKGLKQHMTESDGTCKVKKVRMETSHSNNLVQLADMICGAVNRSYTGNPKNAYKFRNIVKKREKRVQVWPK